MKTVGYWFGGIAWPIAVNVNWQLCESRYAKNEERDEFSVATLTRSFPQQIVVGPYSAEPAVQRFIAGG